MSTLALTHAKIQLIETFRIPIAVIGSAFWPAASMLAFVVPFTGDDPAGATYATASMVTFAVMSTNLFQYGIGVAEDRARPWEPYVRTLPAGALPRFAGRVTAGLVLMAFALLPVVVIAWLFTSATVTPAAFLAAIGVTVLIALPFTLLGLGIGHSLPQKAAIVVAQVLFIPLAFGGGLMTPVDGPQFIQEMAPYLPTGGAVRLMWAAVGDYPVSFSSVASLVAWIVLLGAFAAWAYRRDQGQRFS
jgi:ABC-2 type transport system permease protein